MIVTIRPSRADGTVCVPPSKSYTHRFLIAAACAEGKSHLKNALFSDDTLMTAQCLCKLGAKIERTEDGFTVTGCGGRLSEPSEPLFCGSSASTYRFLSALALLSDRPVSFTGTPQLWHRPIVQTEQFCRDYGLFYDSHDGIRTVGGPLKSGSFRTDGSQSSQFLSGLLMALPLAEGESRLTVSGRSVSRPYIDMTREVLQRCGITVEASANGYRIPGSQLYKPLDTMIEGDAGSAAFFWALRELGDDVTVRGIPAETIQSDARFPALCRMLKGERPTVCVDDFPDLTPLLMGMAALLNGAVFTGTARLRGKESDRPRVMAAELQKCDARVTVSEDTVTVEPSILHAPAVPLESYGDHRIAMALAVILTRVGGQIAGAECVSKSFPDFWNRLEQLHVCFDRKN